MLDIACSLQLCSTMKWSVFFSEAIVIYKSMISLLDTQLIFHVFFYFGPFFTEQIHVEYVRRKCQNRHMTPQIRIWLDHAVQFNTQHMHWRTHTHTHDIHHKKVQHSTLHGSKKKNVSWTFIQISLRWNELAKCAISSSVMHVTSMKNVILIWSRPIQPPAVHVWARALLSDIKSRTGSGSTAEF